MENVAETRTKASGFDLEMDEIMEIANSEKMEERESHKSRKTTLYAQIISGFLVSVALLFVPILTIPGTVILVLMAEVYLLDWTYSRYSLLHDVHSFYDRYNGKSPENEIDQKVARTGLTDSFKR